MVMNVINIVQEDNVNNVNNVNNVSFIYNKLNNSFTFFSLLTIINYFISRTICLYHSLPSDCVVNETIYDKYNNLFYLFLYIYFLYYFNNLKDICNYNFFTKFCFILISLISNFLFSFASSIKELESSIQLNNRYIIDKKFIILYCIIIVFPILIIIINFIKNIPSFNEILIRIILLLWFIIWNKIIYNKNIHIHIHHIFFSFIFCIWCFQKNIIIRIIFFISLGIFIQGFANYKYEGLLTYNIGNTDYPKIIYKDKIIYKCEYEIEFIDYICLELC
jgi:hypothetical protein